MLNAVELCQVNWMLIAVYAYVNLFLNAPHDVFVYSYLTHDYFRLIVGAY